MKTATEDKIGAAPPLPVQALRVDDIVPDPKNRKDHDKASLQGLADEIKAVGLLQPIIVRRHPDVLPAAKYMIVAGERRWLAHKLLKRETIEARVTEGDSTLVSIRKRGAENFHREDLSPIEKADFLQELFDAKMTQPEIAKFVGAKDQSTVSNFMRLRRLPADVKAMIHDGRLSRAHGVALVRFDRWPAVASFIAKEALRHQATAKQIEGGVPYQYDLERKGLLIEIPTTTYSYADRPAYVVPPELQKDPDFLKDDDDWICFAPQKWAPEKKKQDVAYAAAKKVAAKKEASNQSTLSPKDRAARAKKIAQNKAARAKIKTAVDQSVLKLKAAKGISPTALHVVIEAALSDSRNNTRLVEAAKTLGIALPKKTAQPGWSDYGRKFAFTWLASLGAEKVVKLAALAIMQRQADDASRFVSAVPDSLALVASGKGGVK